MDRVSRLMRFQGCLNVTVHKHYIGGPRDSVIFSGGRQACYTPPPPPSQLQLTIGRQLMKMGHDYSRVFKPSTHPSIQKNVKNGTISGYI